MHIIGGGFWLLFLLVIIGKDSYNCQLYPRNKLIIDIFDKER